MWVITDQPSERSQCEMQGLAGTTIVLPPRLGLLRSNYFLSPEISLRFCFPSWCILARRAVSAGQSLNSNHCLAESYRDFIQFQRPTMVYQLSLYLREQI